MCAPVNPFYGVAVFYDEPKKGEVVNAREIVIVNNKPILLNQKRVKVHSVNENLVISSGYLNYYDLQKSSVFFLRAFPIFFKKEFKCEKLDYDENSNDIILKKVLLDLEKIKEVEACITNKAMFPNTLIMRAKSENSEKIFIVPVSS